MLAFRLEGFSLVLKRIKLRKKFCFSAELLGLLSTNATTKPVIMLRT
jgi:hypothetical protein